MLQAWEHFGPRFQALKLENPKTVAAIPDYLDEIRFEMEWVLTMQADDGSVTLHGRDATVRGTNLRWEPAEKKQTLSATQAGIPARQKPKKGAQATAH
jgi:hypothetical protein